jgi:hypothetical protein
VHRRERGAELVGDVGEELVAEPELLVLGPLQLHTDLVTLDRVADEAGQQAAVEHLLGEVVLGAGLDGPDRQLLVVEAGEHHHRDAGPLALELGEAVQPLAVGQVEVEQDHVDAAAGEGGERSGEALHVGEPEAVATGVLQRRLEQAGVGAVVLHQQDPGLLRLACSDCRPGPGGA